MRTIDWQDGEVVAIDQTRLPHDVAVIRIGTVPDLIDAIKTLAVRGAPALGVAGALGVALAARLHPEDPDRARSEAARLRAARPTAVNLGWGIDQALAHLDQGPEAVLAVAQQVLLDDIRRCHALGDRGADWLVEQVGAPVTVQTHCNAGALACVEWGSALGVVRALRERGALGHVYATETRPLLQGTRLTVWELAEMGAPHTLVVDSAGPTVLARGLARALVVGADRITANGDVVNKVGTYPLALAAARAGAPVLVAAPESTVDLDTPTGHDVHIEVRDAKEITYWGGRETAPVGTNTLNYAFDVTPADLVTAIVTEDRIILTSAGHRPDQRYHR